MSIIKCLSYGHTLALRLAGNSQGEKGEKQICMFDVFDVFADRDCCSYSKQLAFIEANEMKKVNAQVNLHCTETSAHGLPNNNCSRKVTRPLASTVRTLK